MERFVEQFGGFGTVGADSGGFDSALRMDRLDDGYRLVADLPGLEREDIDVRYDDGMLTIHATDESESGVAVRSREITERISVPDTVDPEAITASYHNGVLELRLPAHIDDEGPAGFRIDVE